MTNQIKMPKRRPTHPGEMLREEFMPDYGLSVAQLANEVGVSRQSVNELINERRSLSPAMALKLARLFGTTPQYWMNMQLDVDVWDAYATERESIKSIKPLPPISCEKEASR